MLELRTHSMKSNIMLMKNANPFYQYSGDKQCLEWCDSSGLQALIKGSYQPDMNGRLL